jgi:putative transposase
MPSGRRWSRCWRRRVIHAASHGSTRCGRSSTLLYVLRGGISWRALPHDFPPWESAYDHFRRWRKNSTLERIHEVLREQTRVKQGRTRTPTAAVLDTQSVKTAGKRGMPTATTQARRSRVERHILVDTDGLLLSCVVHGAEVQDRDGAREVLYRLHGRAPRLQRIWADGAYTGRRVGWAREFGGWIIDIVRKK